MGALTGIRIVEFAGIGPGPFAAMMLADHGAEVIRVERPGEAFKPHSLARNRRSVAIDLKTGAGVARELCRSVDAIIEGFRPGVMERLGLGPEVLLADNPHLVYGRMTGWGQSGPLAQAPGHDINYIAVAGVLEGIGRPGEPPVAPANYLGDFGGGGMLLAFGMVSALLAVGLGGKGQVVDAAMTEGAGLLAAMSWGFRRAGLWNDGPGANMLSGDAPFYRSYACADGRFVAVGAIERQFYAALAAALGIDPQSQNPEHWPETGARLAAIFATRTRDEWVALLPPEACVSPVLTFGEAAAHPHAVARGAFGEEGPAPAPRFCETPADVPRAPGTVGAATDEVLRELGYDDQRIADLRAAGTIG